VVWVGSPNFTEGRAGGDVAIVLHTMAGRLTSTDSWFKQAASQVSSHFGVGLKGEKHQYVDLADSAWANGILEQGNRWFGRFGSAWPNGRTWSIETEDTDDAHPNHDAPVTDAEAQAVLDCCRLILAREHQFVLTGHHIISPQSRARCPGPRWTSGRMQELAKTLGVELFI
jgi:N-acetylmuramoyl-L-alanine amidase